MGQGRSCRICWVLERTWGPPTPECRGSHGELEATERCTQTQVLPGVIWQLGWGDGLWG